MKPNVSVCFILSMRLKKKHFDDELGRHRMTKIRTDSSGSTTLGTSRSTGSIDANDQPSRSLVKFTPSIGKDRAWVRIQQRSTIGDRRPKRIRIKIE